MVVGGGGPSPGRGGLSEVVAFALAAAGAVDGADVVAVAGVTRGQLGRGRGLHHGAAATPSPRPPVEGPAGADGAEVFLIVLVSLEREREKTKTDLHKDRPAVDQGVTGSIPSPPRPAPNPHRWAYESVRGCFS